MQGREGGREGGIVIKNAAFVRRIPREGNYSRILSAQKNKKTPLQLQYLSSIDNTVQVRLFDIMLKTG